jgi:hypothetical protein
VAIYVLDPSGFCAAILVFQHSEFFSMFLRTTGRVDRRRCKARNDSCLWLNQIANTTDDNLSMGEILWMLEADLCGFPPFSLLCFFFAPHAFAAVAMLLCVLCFRVDANRGRGDDSRDS